MFVFIPGGGRTGTQLANFLLDANHKVIVVEHRRDVLARLHREIPSESIFEGQATNLEVLEAAGIRRADVLAACMANDADNLAVCYLARKVFNVPRTIARINNPRNDWLFNEKFHVDVGLNHSRVMARLIEEQMSLGDMVTLLKLRLGDFSIVEERLPAGSPAVGAALKDLPIPQSAVIAAIIREGEVVVPRGGTVFEAGDEILAIVDRPAAARLANIFSPAPPTRTDKRQEPR